MIRTFKSTNKRKSVIFLLSITLDQNLKIDIFLTYVNVAYKRVIFDSYLRKYKSECFVYDDKLDMTTIYSIQIKTYFHQHPLLKTANSI